MGVGIAVAIIIIAVVVIFFATRNSAPQTAPVTANDNASSSAQIPVATTTTATTATDATTTVSSANQYKDGTYTATGSYQSPGGPDQISVTLTVKNDVVTDASIVKMPGDHESSRYQTMFESGYKAVVVGKKLSSLSVTKVSGSSLTPKGFDDAVAQIRVQAKA